MKEPMSKKHQGRTQRCTGAENGPAGPERATSGNDILYAYLDPRIRY